MKRLLAALFACAAIAGAMADPALPEWWPEEIPRIPPTPSAANYTPANLGQLKHMAALAKAHLDATLVDGAGFAVNAVVASFGPDNGTAYTQAERDENYTMVNLGQLKAVARPFYDRLKAAGYDVKGNLSARLNPVTAWPFDVPWNPSTPKSENYAPANIGQLKYVFSFDLTSFDTDHDGMSNEWEIAQFGNLSQNGSGDFDGDGVVNRSEFLYGGNPKVADGDYDGRSDAEELMEGTNPADPSDARRVRLGYFAMSDSALLTEDGKAPKASVSNILVPGRKGNAASVPLTPATKLIYNHTEADGTSNINLQKGSIRFWIKPNWTTGASGGPGSWGRIFECGTYSPSADIGWWGMYFSPDGASIWLVSQDTVGHTGHSLVGAIDWQAGNWYQVVLTYDATGSALYVNGAKVTTGLLPEGLGVFYVPPPAQRAGGFSIGTDIVGDQRTNATIDEVETFNYRLSADKIAADYAAGVALGLDLNGNGLPDGWDTEHFAGITGKTGAADDYDGDGLTNLEEWKRGTNPKDADSDYDGRSDAMEVADGTSPISDTSVKPVRLGMWTFEYENLSMDNGRLPLLASEPLSTLRTGGFGGRGLNTTGRAPADGGTATSRVRYKNAETNGMPNINYKRGTVRFWIKPSWSSSAPGTTTGGPGTSAALVECGIWTNPPSVGFWALAIDGTGNNLIFATQDDAGHGMNNIGHPISWTAGQWYQVTLVYSPTGSKLYVNGTTTTPSTGPGVTYLLPPPIRAQGFTLGTDRNGNQRSDAVIDEIETFNFELTGAKIQSDYANRAAFGVDSDNDHLPDAWEISRFGGLHQKPFDDPDNDGWTNYDEWQKGTNPNNPDRTPGLPSLGPESVNVSVNSTGGNDITWTPTTSGQVAVQKSTDGQIWVTVGFGSGTAGTFTDSNSDSEAPVFYRVGSPDGWSEWVSTDPFEDYDQDGLSNQEEASSGTNPKSEDSDNDGVSDGVDGWALWRGLSPPRLPDTRYAVITLAPEGQALVMTNRGHILMFDSEGFKVWVNGAQMKVPHLDNFVAMMSEDDGFAGTADAQGGSETYVPGNEMNYEYSNRTQRARMTLGGKVTIGDPVWLDVDKNRNDGLHRGQQTWGTNSSVEYMTPNGTLYCSLAAHNNWKASYSASPDNTGTDKYNSAAGFGVVQPGALSPVVLTSNVKGSQEFKRDENGVETPGPKELNKNSGLGDVEFANDYGAGVGRSVNWSLSSSYYGLFDTTNSELQYFDGGSMGSLPVGFDPKAISNSSEAWIVGAYAFTLGVFAKLDGSWMLTEPLKQGTIYGAAEDVNIRGEMLGGFIDMNGRSGQLLRNQKPVDLIEATSDTWSYFGETFINDNGVIIARGIKARDDGGNLIPPALRKSFPVMLVPVDITEVASDQIVDSDCNKLPTATYANQPNNPMLMATASGVDAHLAIKVNSPESVRDKIFVGVRKMGTSAVLGSVKVKAPTEKTKLEFNALPGHEIYEVVAGYDQNENGSLDDSEATIIFKKTPAGSATSGLQYLDKIIIVTNTQFMSSKSSTISNNVWGTAYAGDLISAFAHGHASVPNANVTSPVDIWANQPGLSHPLGGRWDNATWKDQTYRFTFPDGSPASNDFESSTALQQIVDATIESNKAALIAAYDGTVEWPVSQYLDFHESKDLLSTEAVLIGFNNIGYAFGKVDIVGKLRVSYKKTGANSITVGSIEATGSFDDLYDFAYGAGGKAREAAMVEAGHATLAASPDANSGKVFFTRLEFNTGFTSWNRNY